MLNIIYKYKNGQINIYNYKEKDKDLMKEINKINENQNYKQIKLLLVRLLIEEI